MSAFEWTDTDEMSRRLVDVDGRDRLAVVFQRRLGWLERVLGARPMWVAMIHQWPVGEATTRAAAKAIVDATVGAA